MKGDGEGGRWRWKWRGKGGLGGRLDKGRGEGRAYESTGHIDACCAGVGAVEPVGFGEAEEAVGGHCEGLWVEIENRTVGGDWVGLRAR